MKKREFEKAKQLEDQLSDYQRTVEVAERLLKKGDRDDFEELATIMIMNLKEEEYRKVLTYILELAKSELADIEKQFNNLINE